DATTAFLCLPAIQRPTGTGRTTLAFRASLFHSNGDGLSIEGLDPEAGWISLTDTAPATDRVVDGRPAWGSTPVTETWSLYTVSLPSWLGSAIRVRFVFHADGSFRAAGSFLDDVRVHDESEDPDGDGIPGVRDEIAAAGTDPFVADSDGDGESDGAEVLGGTDP